MKAEDFDALHTSCCEHEHSRGTEDKEVYFHPACHTDGGLEVKYIRGEARMEIACKVCKQFVCSVDVAREG